MESFFSVIIPVYNTEKYLCACLDSVLVQGMEDIEVICVDDGSTDGSLTVLKGYQGKDSRVRIISQENRGQAAARNAGIQKASGRYLLFLDSDDMFREGALQELRLRLEGAGRQILMFDAACLYERKKTKEDAYKDSYYHRSKSYGGPKSGQAMFTEQMAGDDLCDSACLMAVDREWLAVQGLAFRPGMLYEDCLFVFDCLMCAEEVEHVAIPLLVYRVREGSSMTSSPKYRNIRSRLACYIEILRCAMRHDLPEEVAAAAAKFCGMVMRHLKDMDRVLAVEERQSCAEFTPLEDLLAESMEVGLYSARGVVNRMPLLGLTERVRRAESVVVYGAGKVGTLVYRFLKRNGLSGKVGAFAVTEGAGERTIDEVTVLDLEDERLPKDALLLIAAGVRFQWDMLQAAGQSGFHDIEVMNRELELLLEKEEEVEEEKRIGG